MSSVVLLVEQFRELIEPSWLELVGEEFLKPYFSDLEVFLKKEWREQEAVYPPRHLILNAFSKTPLPCVRVVLVGQDPYHGEGQAHGLSFSVSRGIRPPPSLRNIFSELQDDLGIGSPSHGCLEKWAEEGVLLLNSTLTVRKGAPRSHFGKGWERFTDAVLSALASRADPLVFILWGKAAAEKCNSIPQLSEARHHIVLKAPHPSPYSAHTGFFGSRPFSKVNALLQKVGKKGVDWQIVP